MLGGALGASRRGLGDFTIEPDIEVPLKKDISFCGSQVPIGPITSTGKTMTRRGRVYITVKWNWIHREDGTTKTTFKWIPLDVTKL